MVPQFFTVLFDIVKLQFFVAVIVFFWMDATWDVIASFDKKNLKSYT